MTEPIVIFVLGGLVAEVLGVEEYLIVDWDNFNYDRERCPICEGLLPPVDMVCCGVDWSKEYISNAEVYKKAKRYIIKQLEEADDER